MATYTFRLAQHMAHRPVTVRNAAGSTVASGTLDSNASYSADLPVGDYTATATFDRLSYSTAGEVARGDEDSSAEAVLNAAFARRTVVNALDHGVKADGTTNDTAAWNALVASSAVGTVITWTGRSILRNPIIWKTGVSLVGQGWGRSILATVDTTGSWYFPAISYVPANGASTANPLEDCTFRDFEVDGSGLTGTAANIAGKAIFAQFLRRCQFLNLYLHDTVGTALGTDFMPECLIDGVLVERGGRNWDGASLGHAGIGIGVGAWEHEPVIITNCTTIDCGNWGIFVEWQPDQPYRSKGARIVNNVVLGGEGKGIGDRGTAETLIMGNYVNGTTTDGIHVTYGAHDGMILDNHIYDCGGNGIQFWEDTGNSFRVAGNKIARNGGRGIYFNGHAGTYKNFALEDNECSHNFYQGILIDTVVNGDGLFTNGVVRGNRCFNNGQAKTGTEDDGIDIDADMTGVLIAGNRCYDDQATKTQRVGIRLSSSNSYALTDCAISDNHLTGNATVGMTLGSVVRSNVPIRNNVGFATESRGVGTIPDGAATVTINHGLAAVPTSVVLTPQGGSEALWLTTLGASGFIVNRTGTAGARSFTWQAEV